MVSLAVVLPDTDGRARAYLIRDRNRPRTAILVVTAGRAAAIKARQAPMVLTSRANPREPQRPCQAAIVPGNAAAPGAMLSRRSHGTRPSYPA